jgi:hypothetical protein
MSSTFGCADCSMAAGGGPPCPKHLVRLQAAQSPAAVATPAPAPSPAAVATPAPAPVQTGVATPAPSLQQRPPLLNLHGGSGGGGGGGAQSPLALERIVGAKSPRAAAEAEAAAAGPADPAGPAGPAAAAVATAVGAARRRARSLAALALSPGTGAGAGGGGGGASWGFGFGAAALQPGQHGPPRPQLLLGMGFTGGAGAGGGPLPSPLRSPQFAPPPTLPALAPMPERLGAHVAAIHGLFGDRGALPFGFGFRGSGADAARAAADVNPAVENHLLCSALQVLVNAGDICDAGTRIDVARLKFSSFFQLYGLIVESLRV